MKRAGVVTLTFSHVVDDLYQGAVPALIPFLAAAYHYDYLAISGITLAATLISSVAQPAFGLLNDHRQVRGLWVAGMVIAGLGVGLAGLSGQYALIWLAIALSGLGVAVYHPESARMVRTVGGTSARVMSWFALGGNLGFAIGPVVVTVILSRTGLHGTPLLMVPALAMAAIGWPLLHRRGSSSPDTGRRAAPAAEVNDDWRRFGWLTGVVVCRSVIFFGLSSFLELYVISRFHQSHAVASATLTTFSAAGALATIAGGWLADRYGRVRTIRTGYALALPGLIGLVLAPSLPVVVAAAVVCGLGIYLPFAVHTTLGQEYLPTRVGTASGVTLGLAVSAGGIASPLLGLLADKSGLTAALTTLVALPIAALAMSTRLADTRSTPGHRGPGAAVIPAHRRGRSPGYETCEKQN